MAKEKDIKQQKRDEAKRAASLRRALNGGIAPGERRTSGPKAPKNDRRSS